MQLVEQNQTSFSNRRFKKSNAKSARLFNETITDLLGNGNKIKFRAPGGSMHPTIRDGDDITVAPVEAAAIKTGDIILYRHKSGVTAHRVVRISKKDTLPYLNSATRSQSSARGPQSYYILRGDAAVVFDDPISADQVLGKVTRVEREGRRIDPYSYRAKFCLQARRLAARLINFLIS